jgi:hypothetical protein
MTTEASVFFSSARHFLPSTSGKLGKTHTREPSGSRTSRILRWEREWSGGKGSGPGADDRPQLGGKYRMWYTGQAKGMSLIGYATSEDGKSGERASDDEAGVSEEWIAGFIAGFEQAGEGSTDQDYRQGYLTAEELRQCGINLPVAATDLLTDEDALWSGVAPSTSSDTAGRA